MTFKLTVLGSSSALPTSTKFPSAHVLNVHERFFLIDCGEGAQVQLRKSQLKFSQINHIFISHLHGDHVFGLYGLLSTFNLLGRKSDLQIYGPVGVSTFIRFYTEQFAQDDSFKIVVHELKRRRYQKIHEDKVVEVFAFPLKHRIQTFGYLFREIPRPLNLKKDCIQKYNLTIKQIQSIKQGKDLQISDEQIIPNSELTLPSLKLRSFAYCSDTAVYEKLVDYIKGVDLLYHEATFLDTDKKLAKLTGHSTAKQAAKIAEMAQVGKLLIGHFSSRYKNKDEHITEARTVFSETFEAEELRTYEIPLVRN